MSKTTKKQLTSARALVKLVVDVLDDLKSESITCLDVRHLTSVTDFMIIANGRSARHARAIANAVVERAKENNCQPIGVEGQDGGEWILVDLADIVVHVMLPKVREFYDLERLWDLDSMEDAEDSS